MKSRIIGICIIAACAVALVLMGIKNINSSNGIITVKNIEHEYMILHIEKEDTGETCNFYIENDDREHNIMLTMGKGRYNIDVYAKDEKKEPIIENSYEVELNRSIKYRGSSYNVEIDKYRDTINNVIKQNNWDNKAPLEDVWEYFKYNYRYDYKTEKDIETGKIEVMIPNIDRVYENKTGICYDIASFMTCVCRELYGEARLCIGRYSDDKEGLYHAWCEVNVDGNWINMDTLRREKYNNFDNIDKYSIKETY